MDSRPRLPARRRRELDAVRQGPPDLQQLQQQLVSNDTFRQLLDQPHKVAAVLQADPILQQAATDNPAFAQLLDPATMQQALQLLTQPQQQQQAGNTALPIQTKALLQLQNYAMQMQQARAAGCNVRQQQGHDCRLQRDGAAGGIGMPNLSQQQQQQQQQGVTADSQEAMWAALQQRLNKYQQRTQALAAGQQGTFAAMQQQQSDQAWVAPSQPTSRQQQLHSMLAKQATTVSASCTPNPHTTAQAAAAAAAAVPCSEPRASDGSQTLQELLMAFPDVLMSGGPTSSSHATIGLLSAVAEQAPAELAAAAAGDSGEGPHPHLALLQLQPSKTCALPLSPTWKQQQQQQQQQAAGSSLLCPQSISDPAVNAAAAAAGAPFSSSSAALGVSEGSCRPLSAIRSASTLGHRILRPHSSSPIPLGSGSTPLGIEQLGSGEVIVDITPPTKITKELSWSVDPDADYVIDAAASGSFSALPMSAASAGTTAAVAAAAPLHGSGSCSLAAASWGASLESLAAAAAAAAAGSGSVPRMVHSSSGGNFYGRYSSSCDGPLCPLPEDSSSCTAAAVAATAPVAAAAAVEALTSGQPVAAAAAAPHSSTSKTKSANVKLTQHPNAGAAAVCGKRAGANCTAATAFNANTSQQQQHILPVSTHSSSSGTNTAPAAAAALVSANTSYQGNSSYHTSSSSSAFDSQGTNLGGFGPGEAQRSTTLNPRSYYEDVTPSDWRPGDMGEVHGDYLDLYRRAYCSYADAIFPPLWLSLMCVLVSSHVIPTWQLLLLAAVTFWGGLYVMAVKWAGVPTGRLSLSRAVPMTVVSLELLCIGAFVWCVLPAMWLGHSVSCTVVLTAAAAMLVLHLTAHLQNPGYTAQPLDPEEGPYARRLSAPDDTITTNPAAVQSSVHGNKSAGKLATGLQQQQQQQQGVPKLAGRALNSCWTCGVERNLRSKHCPICKRCVERFDHHCPVIGNCVGAGNHRSFVGYLAAMVVCQLLFCHLLGGMFIQQHGMQLLGSQLLMQPTSVTAPSFQTVSTEHPVVTEAAQDSAPDGQTLVNAGQTFVDQGQTWIPGEIELGKPVVAVPGANAAAQDEAGTAAAAAAAGDAAVAYGGSSAAGSFPTSTQAAAATAAANIGRQLEQVASSSTSAPDATAAAAAGDALLGTDSSTDAPVAAAADDTGSLSQSLTGPVVSEAAASTSHSSHSSSRAAELEQLLHSGAGWGWRGWWLTIKALSAASSDSPGLFLLLLLQFPTLFISCTLLCRALALAAANLTVNEWMNRHRYLHLQHPVAGFCNRFDRGPAHNCWEFWVGPAVVDWWAMWQQGEDELQSTQRTLLASPSATSIIRWWDMRWAAYQRKLLAARERRKAVALRRKMEALGLQWDGQDSD